MSKDIHNNVAALVAAVSQHGKNVGIDHCRGMQAEADVLLEWLDYLRNSETEAMGCLALGLVKPALSSLRSEIDMMLGWLYFKDHRVEWNHLRDTGRGFQTKAQVLTYVGNHWPKFQARFKLLEQRKTREEHDPYRLLSAHIHGQTDFTAPKVSPLVELVADASLCAECVALQGGRGGIRQRRLDGHLRRQVGVLARSDHGRAR